MAPRLPERPSLSSLKYQAKQLVKQHHAGDTAACDALRSLPKWSSQSDAEILAAELVLADAQHAVALGYDFPSWLALREHVLAAAADATEADPHVTLSESQREAFRHRGLLRLPGLVPTEVTDAVRTKLHGTLERAGVCENGLWVAEPMNGYADYKEVQSPLQKRIKSITKQEPVMAELCSAELVDIVDQLMDRRKLLTFTARPQVLFTPTNARQWELPSMMWHMDVPRLGKVGCPGVQIFTFIDTVEARAGGTVVASGSHHYVNDEGRVRSKDVKKRLGSHPWFKGLFRKGQPGHERRHYLDEVTRDGEIELQVVELTGEPGDVWFMDLRMLHSPAPNVSARPRLMATQRYALEALVRTGMQFADAG